MAIFDFLYRHDHHHYHHKDDDCRNPGDGSSGTADTMIIHKLGDLQRTMEKLMAKIEDVQNILNVISTEIDKIGAETSSLLAKIDALEAANPDQQAAIDALAEQAQGIADRIKAVDDLVPDAPVVVEPPADTSTPADDGAGGNGPGAGA